MFKFSNKKALSQGFRCQILLLVPGEQMHLDYTQSTTGQDLLNEVVAKLELEDKDYYGLKLNQQIQWIDLNKSIVKQTKGIDQLVLELRFKYYPAAPALLPNESTRYYLYLQLRMDLITGRLRTDDQETLAYLIACILQSELGDNNYDNKKGESVVNTNYVSEFKFVPNQSEQLELEAIKLHQDEDFQGLKPDESELNFLKKACQIDMYGIDPYPVRDGHSRNHMLIGVNHLGISTFQDSKKVNQFLWSEIDRIALDNRLVLIYCKKLDKKSAKGRPLFGFRCPSQEHALCFWRISTEHRFFFTLENSPEEPIVATSGGLFRRNRKIRYSGRVERDLLRNHLGDNKEGDGRRSPLKRSHSLLSKSFSCRPRWQGFEQGNDLQGSLNNIYANDQINRTMPSDLDCFREEEEDRLGETTESNNQAKNMQSKSKRLSSGSVASKDITSQFGGRRPNNLITKSDYLAMGIDENSANINGINQNNNDDDDDNNNLNNDSRCIGTNGDISKKLSSYPSGDFMKTSIVLVIFTMIVALLSMMILDESRRSNSINLFLKKTNLEPASKMLRQNIYLPARVHFRRLVSRYFKLS